MATLTEAPCIYLIKKLWVDPMENVGSEAMGYSTIGYVLTRDEADRICSLDRVKRTEYPWPLECCPFPRHGNDVDSVPRFIHQKISWDLTGWGLDELRAAGGQ